MLVDAAARLRTPPPFAVINARGSSGYAGLFAKYLIESECAVFAGHFAQSSVTAYHVRPALRGAWFLSISQSGQSPDLIESAAAARDAGALTMAIVNAPNSPLAAASEIELPMMAGTESSTGATKSFIAPLAIVLGLAAAWRAESPLEKTFRALPEALSKAAAECVPGFEETFAPAAHSFTIGRGFGYALAGEAALKFKELCGHHAEAFSAAEVLHGPIAMADKRLGVLAFDQLDATSESIRAASDSAVAGGARAIAIRAAPPPPGEPDRPFNAAARAIPLILTFYRHVEGLARRLGHDPDHPNLIAKVTGTR
ncbi:MAG: SIS domain-containing protein [Candidatus Binataceae bacterium]